MSNTNARDEDQSTLIDPVTEIPHKSDLHRFKDKNAVKLSGNTFQITPK